MAQFTRYIGIDYHISESRLFYHLFAIGLVTQRG